MIFPSKEGVLKWFYRLEHSVPQLEFIDYSCDTTILVCIINFFWISLFLHYLEKSLVCFSRCLRALAGGRVMLGGDCRKEMSLLWRRDVFNMMTILNILVVFCVSRREKKGIMEPVYYCTTKPQDSINSLVHIKTQNDWL